MRVIITCVLLLNLIFAGTAFSEKNTDLLKKQSELLRRVISLRQSEITELAYESRENLFKNNKKSHSVIVDIPEKAMLDTAFGIDPLILDMFTGTIHFNVSIVFNNEKQKELFHKKLVLSKLDEEDFRWYDVNIDLSEYSGQKIALVFGRNYDEGWIRKPKSFYDLLPTDFLFWSRPQIRPKKLDDKYNVILISLDTLRADHLHYMGYKRQTSPNIDEFMENGCSFSKAISQAPWTTPSHFSIFTSTYPRVHKGNQPIQILIRRWNKKLPTIASILRENGYMTAAFTGRGSISASFGFYKGFDFYNENKIRDVATIYRKSVKWIKENKERSFFLFFHTYEIHGPFTHDYFVKLENISKKDIVNHRTAMYDGDIRYTDDYLGRFFDDLKKLKLMDKTIIVFTSDHGEDLVGRNPPGSHIKWGHGHNLYNELLHVPLVFVGPEIQPRTRSIDHQVRSIDILPTVLEYLDIEIDPAFQGSSLKAMIDRKDNISRMALSEATSYGTERESLICDNYKYIHRLSYGQLADPLSRGMVLTPLHELYDLKSDPGELNNISEENQVIVKKLLSCINNLSESNLNDSSEVGPKIDISTDSDLMNSLRSLGYVQ